MAKSVTRWTPVAQYPITQTLRQQIHRAKTGATKPNIVSEKLCDDILQRLSPFLSRNAPVDVLDLWPGPGVLSSKVNDFLKPRRHVLIEPDLKVFKPFLEPLVKKNQSYNLLSVDLPSVRDWQGVISKAFPEQGPSNGDRSGALAKNNTLLVLANTPGPRSLKDHFSGARWLSVFMEECLLQLGLHAYGSVRLLASISSSDVSTILPRHISTRSRPSLLTEQVALHAFEVASMKDDTRAQWGFQKQWDMLVEGTARIEQRAAENNVITPAGREYPPIELAPKSPVLGRKPTPYTPRIKTPQNDKYIEAIKKFEQASPTSAEYDTLKKHWRRTCTVLKQENSQVYQRTNIASKQNQVDDLTKTISRLAAEPTTTLATLEPIVKEIDALRASINEESSKTHFDITRALPHLADDRRAAYHPTENFDNALLLFDRRPFQPLIIHTDEMYPRDVYRTLMYFEADPNPPATLRLNRLDAEKREIAIRFFTAFSFSMPTNNMLTVSKLMDLFFPTHSANSMIKSVPSLATYASKCPKPEFDSLPKTLHYNKDNFPENENPTPPPDPISCYQENLNYDLSDTRCRILSISTLWDIAIEYAHSGANQSAVQLNRLLGGTMTSAQSREFLNEKMRKRW
ncbi:hypothetical protein BJX76DRAFT_364933 [Aspergillus varians]